MGGYETLESIESEKFRENREVDRLERSRELIWPQDRRRKSRKGRGEGRG
ncbi:hypothetical protein SAY86_026239 [Trapa natans]|uniref:Uncharacterized protein n=1 Tax=Trapa natans TaxID=22666 RepID=A0AAN7KHK3_TRANT|nr:hypothetical protein SAY86_026239 [Trapa natans]